jgi:hypothetical protein
LTLGTTIKEMIDGHLRSRRMQDLIPDLRAAYTDSDFAEITSFMPLGIWETALAELESLFLNRSRRRDLVVAQSGNTPRKYTNLDRDVLLASEVVPAVFQSKALYEYLEAIVGETVYPIPYVPEEFIAARLHKAGDVHGWHWDDYTFALVWIFKMPDEENGGSLEYVKRAPWNREEPQVDKLVACGPVLRRHPRVGSAYLLKADTALHRVSPLRYDAERMIVCYSFATIADLTRDVDHDSMETLFPESHLRHNGDYGK